MDYVMANNNRIALVTGANEGIGLEIARQLAQAGVLVIMGARDPGRGSAAVAGVSSAGLSTQFIPLDLNDHASIAAPARMISAEHGKLDILVNNAGIVDEGMVHLRLGRFRSRRSTGLMETGGEFGNHHSGPAPR
jgi:NAD(P)-dependent dehydrogenase (short-subunit alcohol dehydrogenase family)